MFFDALVSWILGSAMEKLETSKDYTWVGRAAGRTLIYSCCHACSIPDIRPPRIALPLVQDDTGSSANVGRVPIKSHALSLALESHASTQESQLSYEGGGLGDRGGARRSRLLKVECRYLGHLRLTARTSISVDPSTFAVPCSSLAYLWTRGACTHSTHEATKAG